MTRANTAEGAVIVLARLPRAGRVKSRLAATLGDEVAAEMYRLMAEGLFAECRRLPASVTCYLFYDGDEDAIRAWAGSAFRLVAQSGGPFGRRMQDAFGHVFGQGARRAVIVGSDIPDLSAGLIVEALHRLERYPAVIGPDRGGGYYLLGSKRLYPALFSSRLPWGTDRVYEETLRIMGRLGLAPAVLPSLADIDVEADLWRWLQSQPAAGHPLAGYARQLARECESRGESHAA